MDIDKLNKWMEVAKQFSGGDFWDNIFDQPTAFLEQHPFFSGQSGQPFGNGPLVDVLRTGEEIIVLIDLPGVRKEDVELSVSGEFLLVKGQIKAFYPNATRVSSERVNGSFEKSIRLPENAESSSVGITAAFQDGVLEVHIALPQFPRKNIHIK